MFDVAPGDTLTVYNGPDVSAPLLGNYTALTSDPVSFTSTHPTGTLTFVFTSNGSGVGNGWEAEIICTPPFIGCSGQFLDSGGAAGPYSNNETYIKTIFPDRPGANIIVNFTDFDLDANDTLTVYDGPDTSSPFLGSFTGTTNPGPFTSSHDTGALTFLFVSNNGGTSEGWVADITCEITSTCDTVFYDSGGATGTYSTWENATTTTFFRKVFFEML